MLAGFDGVVDLSHHNQNVDFAAMARGGVVGVILKASQGLSYTDPTFAARRVAASKAGLLVGAYHFGEPGKPQGQLDHFRAVVGSPDGLLLAYDFESQNHVAPTIGEALEFLDGLAKWIGRQPVLYSGVDLVEAQQDNANADITAYPLWLADYRAQPRLPAGFAKYALWQYTDGTHGPNAGQTPGAGACDRSVFNGDEDQLRAWWGS